jgi:sugar phosphate permease
MAAQTAFPSSERNPLSREQRLWQWRVLIATYTAYAGYYLCRKVFSLCKTTLSDELGVGMDQIAHIWTAYLIAYMLGQFLNSYLGRRVGARILLLGGLGMSMVCNIVFGFADSYYTFLVFMFFNGLVQASGWPGCVGGVSEWLQEHERGTVMGVWSTNYQVGTLMVHSIGGFLLANLGWRYAFFGCTLLTFAIWWLIYFWQRNKPEDVGLEPIVRKSPNQDRAVRASTESRISFEEYLVLAFHPVVLTMGLSYFCVKFMRYALDSWLPTFLNLQGMDVGRAAYYSQIFTLAGFGGAIVAGLVLDRWFRGRWAVLCFVMGIGMVLGYLAVIRFGSNPYALSFCFGLVGFMMYGPDTLLAGAAAVEVAGAKNGVAVAGLVNGLGSIGPIFQEEVIGRLIGKSETQAEISTAIHKTNLLALSMSVLFVLMMLVVMAYMRAAHRKNRAPVQ